MGENQVTIIGEKMFGKHYMIVVILAALVLVAGGVGAYYYNQYNSLNFILKNPNVAIEKQTKQLTDQVGKLIMLPTDEQPTIATVTDASKLNGQPFFKNAKNGDKVLIYVKARKAILFDPTKDVIVDVAPVNIAQNNAVAVPGGTVTQPTTNSYIAPTSVVTPAPTK